MRGEILSLRTVLNPARDVSIDLMEVLLIELRKAARIPLSSLYSQAFVRFSNPTQVNLAPVSKEKNCVGREKLRCFFEKS